MISSTSSADRSGRPELIALQTRPPARPPRLQSDAIATESAAFLRAELARQPEVRPEVVARARALAADPDYPPAAVIRHVAGQILGAPDLSEIE
jgi:hypothetical protein